VLTAGGLILAGRVLPAAKAAGASHDITMMGNADGSRVWFNPMGLLIRPGDTVRWINRDPGNSHTTTAYHPSNDGHPLRIPKGAAPWTSDYLMPDQSFSITLSIAGVYDYFCVPHEHAGMVGRIVVMGEGEAPPEAVAGSPIEEVAADPFPAVADIVREGRVR
jgi:plastocyanin